MISYNTDGNPVDRSGLTHFKLDKTQERNISILTYFENSIENIETFHLNLYTISPFFLQNIVLHFNVILVKIDQGEIGVEVPIIDVNYYGLNLSLCENTQFNIIAPVQRILSCDVDICMPLQPQAPGHPRPNRTYPPGLSPHSSCGVARVCGVAWEDCKYWWWR